MPAIKGMNRVAKAISQLEEPEVPDGEEGAEKWSAMQLEIVTFRIKGISPLVHNNPAEFIGKGDTDDLRSGKKVYDDEVEAKLRLYVSPDGDYYHPGECFPKAIQTALKGKKFGKHFATTLAKGAIFPSEPYCLLEDKNGNPLKKYGIDRRGVVIGKSRILRCRPCWKDWYINVALEVDVAVLKPSQVREALSLAGRFPGIGDYRPEKGGPFGRFKVID